MKKKYLIDTAPEQKISPEYKRYLQPVSSLCARCVRGLCCNAPRIETDGPTPAVIFPWMFLSPVASASS